MRVIQLSVETSSTYYLFRYIQRKKQIHELISNNIKTYLTNTSIISIIIKVIQLNKVKYRGHIFQKENVDS